MSQLEFKFASSILLLLIFGLLLVTLEAKPQTKPKITWKCNADDEKAVDDIVARIMTYGRPDRKFPLNKDELRKYCKEQAGLVAKLEAYKDQCLKTRPKQIVAVIIYSIKALATTYCRNPNSKKSKDLMSSAGCANQATFDYIKCNDNYVELLLAIEHHKDAKKQLGQLCCGYVEIFKCIKEQGIKHSQCSESKIEKNSDYIRGFFDNAVNVMCGDYTSDSDRCDKFALIRLKNGKSKAKPNSYFSPLVRVLAGL